MSKTELEAPTESEWVAQPVTVTETGRNSTDGLRSECLVKCV